MVGVWQIFALVIAPTVFWGAYFYYKDRYKPEPISRLLISFARGCFSAVWGVLYAVAKTSKTRVGLTLAGFLASAFLHGLFDYIATDAVWTSASAGVVLALWIAGIVLIKRFRKEQLTDK